MNARHLQDKADLWNTSHPVGTPVTRYKLINPLREAQETKTRSEAWVMGGHSVMVMVEGISGGVLLESVKLIHPTTRQTIVANSTTSEMKSKFKTLRNMDIGTDNHYAIPIMPIPGIGEAPYWFELCPIESLKTCVSTHARDWSINKRDAWIYGIVCGWNDDCFEELIEIRKWTPDAVARLKNLHETFQGLGKTHQENAHTMPKVMGSGSEWTQTPPSETGIYWLWQGDEDSAPIPVQVYSNDQGTHVAPGQYGWTRWQTIDELANSLWAPCNPPSDPRAQENPTGKGDDGRKDSHTGPDHLRWHKLTELTAGDRVIEVMAATCDDGIGVIARWTRNTDDSWKVTAMDTEGGEWETVRIFGDEETVPPEPPSHWDDIQKNSKIHP
jgi:hypothetical protein